MHKLQLWLWGTTLRMVVTIVVALVVIVLVIWGLSALSTSKPKPVVAIPIQLVKAKTMNLPVVTTAMGDLVTPQNVVLKAQQAGAVTQILVKDGQHVKQGQLLLTLNNVAEKAALATARAAYWQEREQLGRFEKLHQQKLISQARYDKSLASYEQAAAALKAAEQSEVETQVKAPFPGRVGVVAVSVGSDVAIGDALVPLVNRQNMVAEYSLPEHDYSRVKVGQAVSLTVSTYPDSTFEGKVDYIAPTVSQTTREFVVRARIDNAADLLSPGMLAQVQQTLVADQASVVIPAIAVVPTIDSMTVYRIKDHKVYSQPIIIAHHYRQWVIVSRGLKVGDAIIASGNAKAHLGATVKVVSHQKAVK